MKDVELAIGGVIGLFSLSLVLSIHYKVFAPLNEQTRRETYEQSTSYIQGKIQYLNRLRGEYELASGDQQVGLKMVILREAATVKEDNLPIELKSFIKGLK